MHTQAVKKKKKNTPPSANLLQPPAHGYSRTEFELTLPLAAVFRSMQTSVLLLVLQTEKMSGYITTQAVQVSGETNHDDYSCFWHPKAPRISTIYVNIAKLLL